jgi:hypothetical protein
LAWLKDGNGTTAGLPINAIHPHPIAHADALAAFAQPGSPGAQQPLHAIGAGLIQLHPAEVGHQGHHQTGERLSRHGG